MSLDVYLYRDEEYPQMREYIPIRENGRITNITREEWDKRYPGREPMVYVQENSSIYSANITHNLRMMAQAAGIYDALWHPDENGFTHAHQLIDPLKAGLEKLRASPDLYKEFNPENGWGDYDGLVNFVVEYLEACEANPSATIGVFG